MSIVITDALVRAVLDSGFDAAFNNGTLELRTGAPPGPGQVPSGTLIWTFGLPADAFAVSSGRSKAKNGVWSGAAAGTGVIGHYRMKATGDTGAATQNEPRMEGTVTLTGGGGDLTVDNTNAVAGQIITVSSFGVQM